MAAGRASERPIRVVFFGTPDFACPSLRALASHPAFAIRSVVTQPDRPAGRHRRQTPPPVRMLAEELGLPVYQPSTLRGREDRAPLIAADADLFVVVAFGLIFGQRTLAIPRLGCINVHASLLPRFRGAAPVAAAILSGDDETGVSIMIMERGLDTGRVIATASTVIEPTDTTESLTKRLAALGADLLPERLPRFVQGEIEPQPQPQAGASIVRPLIKADGWLDWSRPAVELERQVRAMWPWPRAWTTFEGQPVQIHAAVAVSGSRNQMPGAVESGTADLLVRCGEGVLRLDRVQLAGGRPVSGQVFVAGRLSRTDMILGTIGQPEPPPPLIVELGTTANSLRELRHHGR